MTEQAKDAYTWRIIYQDGTTTNEYSEDRPDGRGFAEREAKPVQTLTLANVENGTEVQSIAIPDGAEPVFFRRRSIAFNPITEESIRKTIHCIGWTHGEEARYLFVDDSGATLLTNDLQAV